MLNRISAAVPNKKLKRDSFKLFLQLNVVRARILVTAGKPATTASVPAAEFVPVCDVKLENRNQHTAALRPETRHNLTAGTFVFDLSLSLKLHADSTMSA